mgnify:FL=1
MSINLENIDEAFVQKVLKENHRLKQNINILKLALDSAHKGNGFYIELLLDLIERQQNEKTTKPN